MTDLLLLELWFFRQTQASITAEVYIQKIGGMSIEQVDLLTDLLAGRPGR